MSALKTTLGIICLLLAIQSCSKEENIDCQTLKQAIIEQDEKTIIAHLGQLTEKLEPQQSCSDRYGHAINLNLLVEELNTSCDDLTASVECYSCIYTNPPQSEIRIAVGESSVTVDIKTPENGLMEPIRIH